MLKKVIAGILVVGGLSLGLGLVESPSHVQLVETTHAYAQTIANPPYAVGNYNDFGMSVRLDINPKYSNASQFEVYYTKGYNATTGFKSFTISASPNVLVSRNQWICRTGFQATSMGWWTVKVYSIAKDGTKSTPFITNVNVIR